MIYLYSGTPGSGKSLHTASVIYHLLRINRPVICNFPIALDRVHKKKKLPFYYWDNYELTPKALVEFAREYWNGGKNGKKKRVKEGYLTLFVDESQILFNSRDWNKEGRSEWLKFFTQHRKFGFDVILVAQFDEMLDKQIRSLIEYQVIHRKVSNFGLVGKIMSLFAFGKLFCAVCYWYPMKERLSADWFIGKAKYWSLYDTYADFDSF